MNYIQLFDEYKFKKKYKPSKNVKSIIPNDVSYGEVNDFLDKIENKNISFYNRNGKLKTVLVSKVEFGEVDEYLPSKKHKDYYQYPYTPTIYINGIEVDPSKEIEIIK